MAKIKTENNFLLHNYEEVLENEHPARSQGQLHQEPSFQAYMMFTLNFAYARLQDDFQGNSESRPGKHKKLVFATKGTNTMIKHSIKKRCPIKATKFEL